VDEDLVESVDDFEAPLVWFLY